MKYYNEFDHLAATWLRELIGAGLIPAGYVDERSITEVKPHELKNYTQCHFFAGIGGWSLALQLAGWPENRPVWTGSCPCQPFSLAGKGLAQNDKRHLWPDFMRLIRERRPDAVFGEQVENAIGHGWLDGVSADLEAEGYAVGSCVLGAHSVGAPHKRQRLYWVADAMVQPDSAGRDARRTSSEAAGHGSPINPAGGANALGDRQQPRLEGHAWNGYDGNKPGRDAARAAGSVAEAGAVVPVDHAAFWSDFRIIQTTDGKFRRIPTEPAFFPLGNGVSGRVGLLRGYGNAIVPQVAAEFIRAAMNATPEASPKPTPEAN